MGRAWKTILRQYQSADPDCTGSESRQYNHIYLYGRGSLPTPTDQLSSIGANLPPPDLLYLTLWLQPYVHSFML